MESWEIEDRENWTEKSLWTSHFAMSSPCEHDIVHISGVNQRQLLR